MEKREDARPARRRRPAVIGAVVGALIIGAVGWVSFAGPSSEEAAPPADAIGRAADATVPVPEPRALSVEQIAALPPAVHDAVIPGLLGYEETSTAGITHAYTASSDVPVYGSDRRTPVARLPMSNFLGDPTVIVPVQIAQDWALVLTPARQATPSSRGGAAPAQTAGWVPVEMLSKGAPLDATVRISVSDETLTVTRDGTSTAYAIGVGSPETPTPTGTTGYIQARYEDPGQAQFAIQLTTLHSAAVDEPFGGDDGGLIGVHYNATNTGAVSHGCIRLPYDALVAVDRLPLGTPVVMEE